MIAAPVMLVAKESHLETGTLIALTGAVIVVLASLFWKIVSAGALAQAASAMCWSDAAGWWS